MKRDSKGNRIFDISEIDSRIKDIIQNTYDGRSPVDSLELTDIYVTFDESQIEEIYNEEEY